MVRELLGMIATPRQGNVLPDGVTWCADNGVFGQGWPGEQAWLSWLASYTVEQRSRCSFAVAPDVPVDAQPTLERSRPWFGPIRALGYPVALVAQNGLEDLEVPWTEFDVLFIGGDTAWKLGSAARQLVTEARPRGKGVHMGRVNSERRLRYAHAIGCDSVDGTYVTFGPDCNLPTLLAWLRGVNHQPPLWEDEPQPSPRKRDKAVRPQSARALPQGFRRTGRQHRRIGRN